MARRWAAGRCGDGNARVTEGGFTTSLANSAIVAAATVIRGLMIWAPAAFALAVLRFRGRGLIFVVMVVSFLLPLETTVSAHQRTLPGRVKVISYGQRA